LEKDSTLTGSDRSSVSSKVWPLKFVAHGC
jgi:hypothetical protein